MAPVREPVVKAKPRRLTPTRVVQSPDAQAPRPRPKAVLPPRKQAQAISHGLTTSLTHATHKAFGITTPFAKNLVQSTTPQTLAAQKRKLSHAAAGELNVATKQVKPNVYGVGRPFLTHANAVATLGKTSAQRYRSDSKFRDAADAAIRGDHTLAYELAPKDIKRKIRNNLGHIQVAGIPGTSGIAKVLRTVGATEVNLGRAFAANPVKQTGELVKGIPKVAVGLAGAAAGAGLGAYQLATSGHSEALGRIFKGIKQDYEKRY